MGSSRSLPEFVSVGRHSPRLSDNAELNLKYGPLGDTVNIASRVQGATKYLGADCLFSGNTRDAFQDPLSSRRLARVRVVNIDRPNAALRVERKSSE